MITPSAASILAAISVTSSGTCLFAGLLNNGISLISTNSISTLSAKCFCIYCNKVRFVERCEFVPTSAINFVIIIPFYTSLIKRNEFQMYTSFFDFL